MLSEREARRVLDFLCRRWEKRLIVCAEDFYRSLGFIDHREYEPGYKIRMVRVMKTEFGARRSIQMIVSRKSPHTGFWLDTTLTLNDGKDIIFLEAREKRAKRADVVRRVFEAAKNANVRCGNWITSFVDKGESLEEVQIVSALEEPFEAAT